MHSSHCPAEGPENPQSIENSGWQKSEEEERARILNRLCELLEAPEKKRSIWSTALELGSRLLSEKLMQLNFRLASRPWSSFRAPLICLFIAVKPAKFNQARGESKCCQCRTPEDSAVNQESVTMPPCVSLSKPFPQTAGSHSRLWKKQGLVLGRRPATWWARSHKCLRLPASKTMGTAWNV